MHIFILIFSPYVYIIIHKLTCTLIQCSTYVKMLKVSTINALTSIVYYGYVPILELYPPSLNLGRDVPYTK